MAKKKRKVRVTKKDIQKFKEDRKITTYQRKKKVIPGPWTNLETTIEVNVKLRLNSTGVMAKILGPSRGTYLREDMWAEKGWYPIVFNIEVKKIRKLINEHGIDQVLAAAEKSLNKEVNKKGASEFGKIIILGVSVDNSQRKDIKRRFISCRGKTNKKNISGFMALRKKEYKAL